LTVLSSETFVKGYYSPIFADVFAALVITHLLFPHPRRSAALYVTLFILGIVSTLYYLLGTFASIPISISLRPLIHRTRQARMRVWSTHWSCPWSYSYRSRRSLYPRSLFGLPNCCWSMVVKPYF